MCSYGECLEQVQVTKALSFSCSNCVRMNSSILFKLNLNPRHVGTQSKLGHWHVSHRFTGTARFKFKLLPRDSHAIAYRLPRVQ